MTKMNIKTLNILSIVSIIFIFSSCGSSAKNNTINKIEVNEDMQSENSNESYVKNEEEISSETSENKVISNYFMNIETLEFENTVSKLSNIMKNHKAYIENSSSGLRGFEYSKNYKYGFFTIRVPKNNIELVKSDIKNIGNVIEESTNKEDVSKFYKDTESRLNLIVEKEKRLLKLLKEAEKIDDIIAIESELTDTISEKENLQRDLKTVDEEIEYTTLNLDIVEVRNYSNTNKSDSSLSVRIKSALKDSVYAFKLALENLVIWLIFAIPYIILIAILSLVIVKFKKKKKKKN